MAKPSEPAAPIPEDVARFARAQVAAGRFATVDDVLRAGAEALRRREEAEEDSLARLRKEATDGFAELDRGEGIVGTPDEIMDDIEREVGLR